MTETTVDKSTEILSESSPETADAKKKFRAVRQVEFYFADSNLPYDRFMWTLYTQNSEHWVPIKTVASFKRMREFQSEESGWLLDALKKSTLLEVDESQTNVRRTTEVQEPKNQMERSVYAKGFGEEEPTLQERLEEFFNQYGKTNIVRMRRRDNKKFKGSVFVEFADFSSVDAFLKADPKPTWNGRELLVMSKEDYCEMKIKEKGLTGAAAINKRDSISRIHGFNAFQETDKGNVTDEKESNHSTKQVYLDFMGKKILIKKDQQGNGTVSAEDVPFVKGATLKFEGCKDVKWTQIKDPLKAKFDNHAPYIKCSYGDDFGLVGFHRTLSEDEITFVKETIKVIEDKPITWTVVCEEDEKAFQIKRAQVAAKIALNTAAAGGPNTGSGKGGRGGRGRRGGRFGGDGGRQKGKSGASISTKEEKQAGEKRKRAVEPDGGHDVGVRGFNSPPTLTSAGTEESATKKVKTDDKGAVPVSALASAS